jgi:peptidoglycan/LPS O-acetylase OafA/YrhL
MPKWAILWLKKAAEWVLKCRDSQALCQCHVGFACLNRSERLRVFPHVDLLRALAALLVVIYHLEALGSLALRGDVFWTIPFRYGWVGVDLFLVISGFVIMLSAARAYERAPQDFKWPFMQRRLRRLLPLYVLTCLIFLFLVRPEVLLRPIEQLLPVLLSHALFLQNLSHHTHGVINGVTWSLALEMQFYLALVFTVGFWLRLGAVRTVLVLVGLAWAWRYGTTFFWVPGVAVPHLQVIYTTQLPGTLDAFGMGMALALYVHQAKGSLPALLRPQAANSLAWCVVAGVLLSVAAALLLRQAYWSHTGMVVFWRTLLALGFAAALAAALTCPLPSGGWMRPMHYLGEISYGIYLWHFLVLLSLLQMSPLRGTSLLWAVLLGTLALAATSWHLMEKHWVARQTGSAPTLRPDAA